MFHSHHEPRLGAMWCTRPQPAYISQFIPPGFSELSQSKHLEMLQMMLFTACECLRINQAMFHHWLLIFDPLSHSHSANGNFWKTKTLKLPWQMSSEPNTGSFFVVQHVRAPRSKKMLKKNQFDSPASRQNLVWTFRFLFKAFRFGAAKFKIILAQKKTWKLVRASHPSKACL